VATNKFKTVDLSGNPNLNKFNGYCNSLEAIDLSHNRKLTWIRMSKNIFSALDFRNNPKLTYLDLSTNAYLEAINLPDQPDLQWLELTLDMDAGLKDVNLEGVSPE
jgi:hypothetical protein